MKLTLSQLEEARKNPGRFGQQLAAAQDDEAKSPYNANNFRTYISTAVRGYHAHKPTPALLADFLKKVRTKLAHLRFAEHRIAQYEKTLKAYFADYPTQGVIFIETEKRFSLKVGRHVLTGKVDRLDRRKARGYRGTGIQINKEPWQKRLRWPIIQQALANELGGSSAEVEVGVHCFETGSAEYRIFEHRDIEAALAEAEDICDEVAGIGGEPDIDDLE